MNSRVLYLALSVALVSCSGAPDSPPQVVHEVQSERSQEEVGFAVDAAMQSFEDAQVALDAERLLSHFAPVPDFHLYNDGERITYDEMAAALRTTLGSIRSIEGGFGHVEVMVLDAEHALASAVFIETITDTSGVVRQNNGATTWLWQKLDGQWRIVYGQVEHRPSSDA